ncbi:alpha/beta hydrolase-fold protein [Paenibacillus hodogayensis]|uniref:Alpha/beta hydrolase-fold protein n=1 Tax=Paenibacillus hodogayensis TaxID=279208 RepID=A0ABV5VQY9_9BACL
MGQSANKLEMEVTKKLQMGYLLHLPEEYDSEPEKQWPLLLFLHGSGERGDNLDKVKIHGIPKIAEKNPGFPFIALSPQCPQGSNWSREQETVIVLLERITQSFRVDPKRIYLTGLSMGGYGTWRLACDYPDKFAAIAPVCGGGEPYRAKSLVHLPIWAFHGAKDSVVSIRESENMVNPIQALGGNAKLTVYPDTDHNSWTETYDNPELYEWLLSHRLA